MLPCTNAVHDDITILMAILIEHIDNFHDVPIYPVIPNLCVKDIA